MTYQQLAEAIRYMEPLLEQRRNLEGSGQRLREIDALLPERWREQRLREIDALLGQDIPGSK